MKGQKQRAVGHLMQQSESKNTWRIVVSRGSDPCTHTRLQHSETVHGRARAEKRLAQLIREIEEGKFVESGRLTLSQYLDRWLKDSQSSVAPHTAQMYVFLVERHIKTDKIGQLPISKLTPSDLQRFYSEKLTSGRKDGSGGLGNRSVRYIHTTLHGALRTAVKLGLLARNPADSVDVPKVRRHEMQTMNETDIHLFLDYAKDTEYYALFYTALFTGMRRSEMLALRWSDVDLPLCQLSVTRTLHQLYTREIIYREPKTAKGRRLIALTPSTALVLRDHFEKRDALKKSLGLPPLSASDLVFCHYDGKPLLPDSVTQAWRHLAGRAGLKGIRLHDCRHSHASLLLKQGVHPKVVSERLGHASIQITLDVYSHVLPGIQQAAAARFDDMVIQHDKAPTDSGV